jgi:RND family efflux transporter MFP subunit
MRSLSKVSTLIASSFFLFACGEKKDGVKTATPPVPVNLFVVHPAKAVYYDRFPGTVVPMMQVDIRPVVEGYVTGIFFKEGEHVKKGQKLYSIDDSKFQATYNQAQANLRVAESNLEQAQKDANRYIYLNEHEAVAKQILDHAMTTLQNAKNQVTAAKQEIAKARTDLSYSVITAPFDGIIGISQVKLGNTVVPGQTIMNTISTDDPMAVDFVVNEKQIPRFVKLKQQTANPADSIFTIQLSDNSVYDKIGKIHVIDRGVNPQTGSIIVRLIFQNGSSVLRAGMSCTVRVRNDDTSAQLMIPGKAVQEQMGEYFVYVAKDTLLQVVDSLGKKEMKPALCAVQKKVIQGQVIGDRIIIRSGLQDGDHIVADGVQALHDGWIIKVTNDPKKETNK